MPGFDTPSYDQTIRLLHAVLMVQSLALLMAIALAAFAVREMRQPRLIAAKADPLWDESADDASLPGTRAIVQRLRKAGAL